MQSLIQKVVNIYRQKRSTSEQKMFCSKMVVKFLTYQIPRGSKSKMSSDDRLKHQRGKEVLVNLSRSRKLLTDIKTSKQVTTTQ